MDLTKNFNSHIVKVEEGRGEYRLKSPPSFLYGLSGRNIYILFSKMYVHMKRNREAGWLLLGMELDAKDRTNYGCLATSFREPLYFMGDCNVSR